MSCIRSALTVLPPASVKSSCEVSSALKGESQEAAKSKAFCTTRRVSLVMVMPLFGMRPAVLREAQASRFFFIEFTSICSISAENQRSTVSR